MIKHDDVELYLVFVYDEIPLLSNLLKAVAYFKRECGQLWPREICVREGNRFPVGIGLGSDTELKWVDWTLLDALYLSLYSPWPDIHQEGRQPTRFVGGRSPIEDANRRYRGHR